MHIISHDKQKITLTPAWTNFFESKSRLLKTTTQKQHRKTKLQTEKQCYRCKETKPINQYRLRGDTKKPDSYCKECAKKISKALYRNKKTVIDKQKRNQKIKQQILIALQKQPMCTKELQKITHLSRFLTKQTCDELIKIFAIKKNYKPNKKQGGRTIFYTLRKQQKFEINPTLKTLHQAFKLSHQTEQST